MEKSIIRIFSKVKEYKSLDVKEFISLVQKKELQKMQIPSNPQENRFSPKNITFS